MLCVWCKFLFLEYFTVCGVLACPYLSLFEVYYHYNGETIWTKLVVF